MLAAFEAALAAAASKADVEARFEAAIRDEGLRWFDYASMRAAALSRPAEACRFYGCNYFSGDPWSYFSRDWPRDDPVVAELARRTTPFDYVAFIRAAPKTPATIIQKSLLTLYDVRRAWIVPLGTPEFLQFVTVYQRGGGDEARFLRGRERVFMLAAAFMDRCVALHAEAGAEAGEAAPALSAQEGRCLALFAEGRSTAEIGAALGISQNTVRFHVKAVFRKLGARSRAEAVARAAARGLLPPA